MSTSLGDLQTIDNQNLNGNSLSFGASLQSTFKGKTEQTSVPDGLNTDTKSMCKRALFLNTGHKRIQSKGNLTITFIVNDFVFVKKKYCLCQQGNDGTIWH